MTSWLDPLRRTLDAAPGPVTFFFRDDDVGWGDEQLFELLDVFDSHDLPLDLAVIPLALTHQLAHNLRARLEARPDRLAVHQHGFAHANHEREGRKSEFGPGRPPTLQQRDIELGRARLVELLGPAVGPIFTPPWNRCTAATGACLARLGFGILSRDHSAEPLKLPGLSELPVHIDWFARRKGARLGPEDLGLLMAGAVAASAPVGIMFHHALMDASKRRAAGELLAVLAAHGRARCGLMQAISELKPEAELDPPRAREIPTGRVPRQLT